MPGKAYYLHELVEGKAFPRGTDPGVPQETVHVAILSRAWTIPESLK